MWLLKRAGLITIKEGLNKWEATQKDSEEDRKNLKFKLLGFAAQSRVLADPDAARGYTEYYLAAKIPLQLHIFAPPPSDQIMSQLTMGTEYLEMENIKRLTEAFQNPAVQEFLATDPAVKGLLLPIAGE